MANTKKKAPAYSTPALIEICPRCGWRPFTPYGNTGAVREARDAAPRLSTMSVVAPVPPPPALSRRDNKTFICGDCGVEEALADFAAKRATS